MIGRSTVAGPSRRSFDERNGLSSSTASQASNASLSTAFLHLDDDDIVFFDDVIDLLPAEASTFAELKRAYNRARSSESLAQPIDPDRDATLWDTLLRLTHVRGRTWSERWNAVREMLGLNARRTESEEEQTDARIDTSGDEEDDTPHHRVRPKSWHSAASNNRPDVFGLPTSSMGTESPSADAHMRRRHQGGGPSRSTEMEELRMRMAALSAEADSLAGSLGTARKPILIKQSRSAFGPSSTPRIGNQDGRRLRFAAADQEYELSKATTVESATDEEERGTRRVRHPREVNASAAAKRRFDEVVARARQERSANQYAEKQMREQEEEDRLAQAYMQADKLFVLTLQHKSLTWWLTLHRRHQQDTTEAAQLYARNIISKAMLGWQRGAQKHQKGTLNAAKIDLVRCKLNVWRTWTRRHNERRRLLREERKMQLRGAFEVTRAKLENRLQAHFYNRWRHRWIERRAERFRKEHLLRGSMSLWRIELWRTSKTRAVEARILKERGEKEVNVTFTKWLSVKRIRDLEKVARSYDARRTTSTILDVWLKRSEEKRIERRKEAVADRWLRRRVREKAFVRWRTRTDDAQGMQRVAEALLARREEKIKSVGLHLWLLRERECLYRRVQGSRIIAQVFEAWYERNRSLQTRLAACESQIGENRAGRLLSNTFQTWRRVTQTLFSVYAMSAKRDERKVTEEALAVWKAAADRRSERNRQAVTIAAHKSLRNGFEEWKRKIQEARARTVIEKRHSRLLRTYFTTWSAESAQKREETLAVAKFRGRIERRKRHKVLRRWVQLVIDRKSLFMEAAEMRDKQVLQRSWHHWLDVCVRHDDMLSLSKSFLDVKREDRLRTAFKGWLGVAQLSRARRQKAERFAVEEQQRRLHDVFQRWYARYAEALLHQQELEWLLQRQESVKAQVLDRWKAKTQSLPAVRLNHARLTSYALHFWKARLPSAKQQRLARTKDRMTMQSKAFEHWQRMAKAKRAFRAAARFGGPSAVRLRSVHRRMSGGGNGSSAFGGAFGQGQRRRPSSRRAETLSDTPVRETELSSLRESDLNSIAKADSGRLTTNSAPPAEPPPTSIRRWRSDVQNVESSDIASEPDVIVGRENERGPSRQNRFRSLVHEPDQVRSTSPASRTQSEATLRIRNSPRKVR